MPGYSGTPLTKKLGIKPGHRVVLVNAPSGFEKQALGGLPDGVKRVALGEVDFAMVFAKSAARLNLALHKLFNRLAPAGMLWVAWPKKASGVPTDLSFDVVQKQGLALGLVDVKICAVTDVWSGLKFVIRLQDRVKRAAAAQG
jgi:hypothetical protein